MFLDAILRTGIDGFPSMTRLMFSLATNPMPQKAKIYHDIYSKGKRDYWSKPDAELRAYAAAGGFPYDRDDDSKRSAFGELPIIANYFYHEEVKKSAKKEAK